MLFPLARFYQSLFPVQSAESSNLRSLLKKDKREYFKEYFRLEQVKGIEYLSRFTAFAKNWKDEKALDFGCGGGGLSCYLGGQFKEVWGFDLEADKIAFGKEMLTQLGKTNVHIDSYDGKNIPKENGYFDAIVCIDVMEHLPDPAHYIAEFYRLLKKGGRLYISFGPPWKHPHGKHMWETVPGWWSHLIFPRSVVMKVRGIDPKTTWAQLGLNCLTVGRFNRILSQSPFRRLHQEYRMKKGLKPLSVIPFLREYFTAEVVGVYEKTQD